MFAPLKTRNFVYTAYKNRSNPTTFSKSPGVTSFSFKGNEKDRLVRCRHCGFPCDLERDVLLKDGSYAGFGINQGAQLEAGTSVGDRVVPAATTVASSVDKYYARSVSAGCPSCGSLVYR